MDMVVLPLGAAQEVGRSCFVVNMGAVNVMLDCGVHLGYFDHRQVPDFAALGGAERINDEIAAVIITHFHLDHIGALPYLTEVLGYRGPIYMTHATKAVARLQLEDFYQIFTRRGDALYSLQQISACLERVTGINLETPVTVEPCGLTLTAYYAGHVMGAAMFHCRAGPADLVYSGDYNMVSDRLVGAAKVPRLSPDLLITESTYATTVRDSRAVREKKFLDAVLTVTRAGGKVLIPVTALGNAQELSVLLDGCWKRQKLQVPIYMTEGAASKAASLFATLAEWGSQQLQGRGTEAQGPPISAMPQFELWKPDLMHAPGPCVLLATPGMLQGGHSLRVFKEWATDPKNLVMLPGHCISGTIGNMLMSGFKKGTGKMIQVEYLAFSAHTDAKGIMDLAHHMQPRNIVLVHGEADKMRFLQGRLQESLGVPCYVPSIGVSFSIALPSRLPVTISAACMRQAVQSAGQSAITHTLQELADCGSTGTAVLRRLRQRLAQDAAETPQLSEEAATRSREQRAPSPSTASDKGDVAGVLEQLSSRFPRVVPEELDTQCMAVVRKRNDGVRLSLVSAAEASDVSTAPEGGDARVEDYVQLVAGAVARWLTRSGHGSVHVDQHGNMLSIGEVRARLVPENSDVDNARTDRMTETQEAQQDASWIWEVLLSGSTADCRRTGLDVCRALLSTYP